MTVRDDAGKADLAAVGRVEADDSRRGRDQLVHHLAGPAGRPVGLLAEIAVDGFAIDSAGVVVELEPSESVRTKHRSCRNGVRFAAP